MQKYVVNDIHEYIDLIDELNNDGKNRWFRGQSSASFYLTPNFIRKNVFATESWNGEKISPPILSTEYKREDALLEAVPVKRFVEEFKKQTEELLEYNAGSYIEWECIAQHYGVPTRMLDWTSTALNALYFAVCDCTIGEESDNDIEEFMSRGFSNGGGAVYIVEPEKINSIVGESSKVFDIKKDALKLEKLQETISAPVFISGLNKEKRISRQGGKFSMTCSFWKSLDTIEVTQDTMKKIFIPYSSYEKIRKQLKALGITHDYIYVENDKKDEIASEIANRITVEFLSEMKSRI